MAMYIMGGSFIVTFPWEGEEAVQSRNDHLEVVLFAWVCRGRVLRNASVGDRCRSQKVDPCNPYLHSARRACYHVDEIRR